MVGFPQMENGCSCRDFHDHPAQLRVRCHATSDKQRKSQAKPNRTEVARAGGFRNASGQEGTTPPGRIRWVRAAEFVRLGSCGWVRAAVLGANDCILSTSSLVLRVAAAHPTHNNALVAGIACLVAGRCLLIR